MVICGVRTEIAALSFAPIWPWLFLFTFLGAFCAQSIENMLISPFLSFIRTLESLDPDQGGEGRSEHTKGFCPRVPSHKRAQVWSQAIASHHDFGAWITPRF